MQIAYPRESKEGIILRRFGKKLLGNRIAIIQTEIPAKPIIVRAIPPKNAKGSNS
jgi:hypothetical protein